MAIFDGVERASRGSLVVAMLLAVSLVGVARTADACSCAQVVYLSPKPVRPRSGALDVSRFPLLLTRGGRRDDDAKRYLLLDERSGTSVPLRVDYLFPYTRISPLKPLPPNRWFKLQYRLMTIHRPNGVKTYHAPMVVRFRTGARGLAVPRDRPRLVAVTQQPPHPATSSCGYQSRTAIFTVSSGLDRRMVGSFVWEVAYRRGRRWIPLRQFRPLEETIARTWALRRTLSVGSTQCSREPELGKGRYEVRVQLVRSDGQRWNTRSVRLAPLGRKRSKPRTGP